MFKLKPLANALSLTVTQSNEILSLLTSVTFNPPMVCDEYNTVSIY